MSIQTWQETLITGQGDGTALTNTVTATSIIPAAAKLLLPPNYFAIGKKFRIKSSGRISTFNTGPGTLTFEVRIGGVVAFTGGAMVLIATGMTNSTWELEIDLSCRAIGAGTGTTLLGTGRYVSRTVIGSGAAGSTGVGVLTLPDTAPVVGAGFDATVTNALDLFATWSVANAANSIQTHQYSVEALN